jgi:hypothetical protein
MEKIKERYEEMLEDKMKKHRHAKEEKWIEKRKRKNWKSKRKTEEI